MTRNVKFAGFIMFVASVVARAQESPAPVSPLPLPTVSGAASVSPTPLPTTTEAATSSSTISPSPAPGVAQSPARSVKISFLPPPMEGTISLGIYDHDGKLVRVLIQEGEVEEFEVGADALIAKWDGKNDQEEDLPPAKYRARGYAVGHLKIEEMGKSGSPPADLNAADRATVKLVSNPLAKSAKTNIDVMAAINEEQIILKTTDGLPLATVIEAPKVARVGITKSGEKAVDVWADGGDAIAQIHVSNVDKMMAFDAGEIELKQGN